MKTLTAANAVIMLSVPSLVPISVQMQGFAADDVFDVDNIDNAETAEGVDGKLSYGWVFHAVKFGLTLQADSDSVEFFEQLGAAEAAVGEKYPMEGNVYLTATGRKYTMNNGILMNYSPFPNAKKILQPRKFNMVFETVAPAAL